MILCLLLMLVGLLGSFLPGLPGAPLVFLGALLYGWYTGFAEVTAGLLVVFFLLTVAALLLEYAASALGARRYGASRAGVAGALLGGLVGIFLFPPLGLVLGPLGGAFLGELLSGRGWQSAGRSGFGSVLGLVLGTTAHFTLSLLMLVLFLFRVI